MKNAPWWVWVVGALVIALAVGVGVFVGRSTVDTPPISNGDTTKTPSVEPTVTPDEPVDEPDVTPGEEPPVAQTQYVRVYLARGESLGVALRPIPATKAVATAAMQQLLLGATAEEQGYGLASHIPVGTKLRGLNIANGTATVDLSKEYAQDGGLLAVTMRLGQVVFTLTQFPSVDRVVFHIDGKKVDVFTGEGIMLDKPQTRADYEYVMPALFVEGPTPGATVSSPIRVWGTGNTFEASFMVRVLDDAGNIVVEQPGMATSGSGERGTFDISVPYPNAARPAAKVVVFEYSAKDGSVINAVEIPVTMIR